MLAKADTTPPAAAPVAQPSLLPSTGAAVAVPTAAKPEHPLDGTNGRIGAASSAGESAGGAADASGGSAGRGSGGSDAGGGSFMAQLEARQLEMRQARATAAAAGAPSLAADVLSPARRGGRLKRMRAAPASGGGAALREASAGPCVSVGEGEASAVVVNPRVVLWTPPQSPFSLIEEVLYHDPWQLLLACMLLNKTTAKAVRAVLGQLLQLCPTPEAAVAADVLAIQEIIQPLGLFRKRAIAIQRFSKEYMEKQWQDPTELYGIGKYAADAYYIFCRGAWADTRPEDKDLLKYVRWLASTGGAGLGLERDTRLIKES